MDLISYLSLQTSSTHLMLYYITKETENRFPPATLDCDFPPPTSPAVDGIVHIRHSWDSGELMAYGHYLKLHSYPSC